MELLGMLFVAAICLVVAIGLCWIPASIAEAKGRSFGGFFVFALFFFPAALVVALLISPEPDKRTRVGAAAYAALPGRGGQQVRVPPAQVGPVDSGDLRCVTQGCDAAGIRTHRPVCPVCDTATEPAPVAVTARSRSAEVEPSAAVAGRCENPNCSAAGLPATSAWCVHCGWAIPRT